MAEPHLDHPGEWHWFSGFGPAEVIGPCPHDCWHVGQSVIAWGPDDDHYELVQCDTDPCSAGCRAWTSNKTSPRARSSWLQVRLTAASVPVLTVQCECIQRGMTGGKAHPRCPVHGPHDACFELDGARVHGDPQMSDESRDALREVIAAARTLLASEDES